MGTLSFEGISFMIYSDDHPPAHVHARYGSLRMVLDLPAIGGVLLSSRNDNVEPINAKRNEVRRVLRVARMQEAELRKLWDETHGGRHD